MPPCVHSSPVCNLCCCAWVDAMWRPISTCLVGCVVILSLSHTHHINLFIAKKCGSAIKEGAPHIFKHFLGQKQVHARSGVASLHRHKTAHLLKNAFS